MHIYIYNYYTYIYIHIHIYIHIYMHIIMYNLYSSAITINKLHIPSDIPIMLRFLIWVAIFHLTIARLGGSLLREQGGTESGWRWSGEGESGRGTQMYMEVVKKMYNCQVVCFLSSPPARWGLLDFNRALLLLLRLLCLLRLLTRRLLLAVQIPVGTAGPPPRAPDPSGHCRTSTASCRSQWALADLNRDFQVAVGTAGPQPRLLDRSGHCRTSTATFRSQWALPDLNGKNVRRYAG